jgi:hypothetical protein
LLWKEIRKNVGKWSRRIRGLFRRHQRSHVWQINDKIDVCVLLRGDFTNAGCATRFIYLYVVKCTKKPDLTQFCRSLRLGPNPNVTNLFSGPLDFDNSKVISLLSFNPSFSASIFTFSLPIQSKLDAFWGWPIDFFFFKKKKKKNPVGLEWKHWIQARAKSFSWPCWPKIG